MKLAPIGKAYATSEALKDYTESALTAIADRASNQAQMSSGLLVAILAARADGFQQPHRCAAGTLRWRAAGRTLLHAKTRALDPLDELEEYWQAHGAKWKRTLEILDVRAAWQYSSNSCSTLP